MYSFLLHFHSGLRYLLILAIVTLLVSVAYSLLGKKNILKAHHTLSLILMILAHLQFLFGLILFGISPMVDLNNMFKDDHTRYWSLEHISMMLVAIILITLARITSKKAENSLKKLRKLFWFNLSAVVVIVIALLQSGRGIF